MRYVVQVVAIGEDGSGGAACEVAVLEKGNLTAEEFGLTLEESRDILKGLQGVVVRDQATRLWKRPPRCIKCKEPLQTKERRSRRIVFRTLFGTFELESPRYHVCPCLGVAQKTISPLAELLEERFSPQYRMIMAELASRVSFEAAAQILSRLLPVDEKISPAGVRNQVLNVARRLDRESRSKDPDPSLGSWNDTWERERRRHVPARLTATVAMDGAFVPCREPDRGRFGVIVGNFSRSGGPPKCFGWVTGRGERPEGRLFEFLRARGIGPQHEVCFLSDGQEDIDQVKMEVVPRGRHILDWFHIAMRFNVLGRIARGLKRVDPNMSAVIEEELEGAKWTLWHGRREIALLSLSETRRLARNFRRVHRSYRKLSRRLRELIVYLERNEDRLAHYAAVYRAGNRISTAVAESTVNRLVARRFVKKQQMRWSREGAHLLLQVRAAVLNGELEESFKRWYPKMAVA